MGKKSVTKNYIYNVIYQVLVMVIPLITTPYLSRVLGAENIGIYSYTLSITTYFVLFGSLGVALYGQREIAYVQDNIQKRSKSFYEILLMRFITLGISLSLFYLTFCLKGEYIVYYKILILEIIANSLDISWFFQGLEEFKKTVIRNTIVKTVSVICIFLLVKTSEDLVKYFVIYVLSSFIGNISLWLYLPKYTCKIKIKQLNLWKHLKPTLSLFIPQVATQIYTVLDKTMIGTFVADKSEVGYYEQAQKIVKLLLTIATSLGTVMIPRMASTYAKGDFEKIKEYMRNSFSFIMLLAYPLMFGIVSIATDFVPIFYGPGYEKVIYLICIISPIIIAIGLSNVIGTQYLMPTKQQKKYTISVVSGAMVNLVLNLVLINYWKSIGASIATVVAEFVVTGVQLHFVKNEIKLKEIIALSYKYFISGFIMFIGSLLVKNIFTRGILTICVQVVFSVIVYFSILLCMKDKFLTNAINEKIRRKQ